MDADGTNFSILNIAVFQEEDLREKFDLSEKVSSLVKVRLHLIIMKAMCYFFKLSPSLVHHLDEKFHY